MRKRLTTKERFFNNINLTADDEVYVGIDVHKINTHPLDSVGHLPTSCHIHQHRIAYPSIEPCGHWVWLMPSIAGNLELLPAM